MEDLTESIISTNTDDVSVMIRSFESALDVMNDVEEEDLLIALAKVPGHVRHSGGGRVVGGEDVGAVDDDGHGGLALTEPDLVDGRPDVVHGGEDQGSIHVDHQVLGSRA